MTEKVKLASLEVVQIVSAVALFLSPWVFDFTGNEAAAWSAWLTAVAILLFATLTGVDMADWGGWGTLFLGTWTMLSPAVGSFLANLAASWSHIVLGGLVSLSALWIIKLSVRPTTGGSDDWSKGATT